MTRVSSRRRSAKNVPLAVSQTDVLAIRSLGALRAGLLGAYFDGMFPQRHH